MIKWGVIGTGGIARSRTIPEGITEANNAELSAVMDVDSDILSDVTDRYGVKGYKSIDGILDDGEIDAIYIATPNHLHREQAIRTADAGKHALVEKPLALTTSDCKEIIAAFEQNDLSLAVGYMMRFHSHNQRISEMVHQGDLGSMVFGRAQLSAWFPPMDGSWRQNKDLGGGGALMDMGGHCIDLLEMILGEVVSVCCNISNLVHDYPVEDTAIALLNFESGHKAVVDTSFGIPDISSQNRLEIYGSKGSILAEGTVGQDTSGRALAYLQQEEVGYQQEQQRELRDGKDIKVEEKNIYQAEIENVSASIEEDTELKVDGHQALHNLEIILACYKSAKQEGKVVNL